MWPGQQQPGGEQNPQHPQHPNPYQTPGYQAPNPYQTPGYQTPNPYQQPGGPWGPPGAPGGPQPPYEGGGGGKNGRGGKTVAIAIVTAVAVIAAGVVTAVLLLGNDDQGDTAKGGDSSASPSAEPSPAESESPGEEPDERPDDPSNPRDGLSPEKPEPVVSGWQVVTNAKHHNAFDVPPEWKVKSETTIIGYGQKDEDDPFSGPQVAFSGPAYHKEAWCTSGNSRYTRAIAGSKGAQGSRGTAEAAQIAAENFVYFAYGEQKDTVKSVKPTPFSNEHGITGHIASATATGVEKKNKCDSDGKVVAVSWLDGSKDLRLWLLVTDAGVEDEVSQETIDKMTASLRPYAED